MTVGAPNDVTLRSRMTGLSGWASILLLYLASRLVTTAVLATVFVLATANDWAFPGRSATPDFARFLSSWDGTFYRRIATDGYPTSLPTDGSGSVVPNSWAFLPVFPYLGRAFMGLTNLPFDVVGPALATLFGAGAAVLLYRIVLARTSERAARWATILFCFGPLSFVLQVAYAESLFLLLTFGSLLALTSRRYLTIIPLGVIAAFTRPGALAIALVLGIHLVVRWVSDEPFAWRDRLRIALAGAVISVAGLAWPLIAGAVTGDPDAYLKTELSWWVGFVGEQHFAPLTPWFLMAGRYLGTAGIIMVVLVIAAYALWLRSRPVRALGHEIVGFSAAYGLYLFAVFLPQQSLFRLVMPLAPLLADDRLSSTRSRRITLLAVGLALQPVAVWLLWFVGYP